MKRKHKKRGIKPFVPLFVLFVVILPACLYFGGTWLESLSEKPEPRGDSTQRYSYDSLLEHNGETYRRRRNVTTMLLMGIDHDSGTSVKGYRNGGQADFLRLLIFDSGAKEIRQVAIDRDTMTPITVLGVLGNRSGLRTAQISLSHGFGDGGRESCGFTKDAVSNLFLGIPIDFYVAMNLDGISVLNDALGGVTVTLKDDFSSRDPAMTEGTTLTLMGDQAEIYVRERMNIGIGTNEARMDRQEEYLSKLAGKLGERISKDKESIGALYDELDQYLVTDTSRGRLINEIWAAKDYARLAVVTPEGTHRVATDGFMQFHADEAALEQIVIDLFYEKVK